MTSHKSPVIPTRRSQIAPRKPYSLPRLLLDVMNKARDLAHLALPAYICEPLSYLQRMSECLSNSYLLDHASEAKQPGEELVYIAAFLAASYSSSAERINKPFNPLLHETYEWDRSADLGWKLIAEQVCHYPPTSAINAQSAHWEYSEEVALQSKMSSIFLPSHDSLFNLINGKFLIVKLLAKF